MGFTTHQLALPGVLSLILFLSFSPQYLFANTEPGPLSRQDTIVFNTLIALLTLCYFRAVWTDPGRIPSDWVASDLSRCLDEGNNGPKPRWCRRCNAAKPPRAHHCKMCKRCIPKMDHHCPWTMNCVSHLTFPHFIRFVGYAVSAMLYLEYLLYIRAAEVWSTRHMPSHYGPAGMQLAHLFILIVANSVTLFGLAALLIRSLWSLVSNTYTVEGWEIERHQTLVRRARVLGGFLDGPDGTRIRIIKQEYPYDIGLWQNVVQGMGTANILAWFWPFSSTLSIPSGIRFETNGFEDPNLSWPPPDPDRMPRLMRKVDPDNMFMHDSGRGHLTEIEAFRLRQLEDLKRFQQNETTIRRRPVFHQRYKTTAGENGPKPLPEVAVGAGQDGEEAWRNYEGERLADFGIDEEAEFYDEEDVPLAELIRHKER